MNKLHIIDGKIRFESVRGVGTIEVDFQPNQRVYVFIGKNGVGKTKLLECLCQSFNPDDVEYKVFTTSSKQLSMKLPLVYVPTILRNAIVEDKYEGGESIGNLNDRRADFKEKLIRRLRPEPYPEWTDNIHRWIILRAQSSNRYQSKQDNRGFELEELLRICHQIDKNIDAEFLEIYGNNRVFLQVEKQKRELSELSSGFASILKIVQTIIDGYSSLTNEQQLANVRGVVLY